VKAKVQIKDEWTTEIYFDSLPDNTGVIFRSDAHHDNPHCDRGLELEHLKLAKENGYLIVDVGDCFCAMQGVGDPRGKKQDLRPEYLEGEYLDTLVNLTAKDYADYANNFIVFLQGNHERTIMQRKETNLTERLAENLRHYGFKGAARGIAQFLVFKFPTGKQRDGSPIYTSYVVYVEHGYGGGGPVTKGVIQSNRRQNKVAGVDAIVSGHIHERWQLTNVVLEYSSWRGVYHREIQHIALPTYKQEMGPDTWHTAQGRPSKPLGCYLLEFNYTRKNKNGVRETRGLKTEWRYLR